MGTASLTAALEVLWISNQTNMNMFLATLFFAASVSAEADPYLLGYHGLGYAGYPGYAGYGYALPYAAAGYASVSPSASLTTLGGAYAGAGRYVANSAGVVHVAKREAEADPYVLGYGGYPGYGYAGLGYAGYGGYGSYSPSAGVSIAGHAPAALPAVAGAYAGAGRYCANSAGTIHCA